MNSTCFWCGKRIHRNAKNGGKAHQNTSTADHFVSKPLHKLIGDSQAIEEAHQEFTRHSSRKTGFTLKTCRSCWSCNKERGEITRLLTALINLRNSDYTESALMNWYSRRCQVIPCAEIFRERIRMKLTPRLAVLCLKEIDEVFPQSYRPIS